MRTPEEEIAQLRQEKESLRLELAANEHARIKDNAYLLARAERAEAALREYGQHKPECELVTGKLDSDALAHGLVWHKSGENCTCGFKAVIGAPQP